MGNSVSQLYWNGQVQNSQARELRLTFIIDAAKSAVDQKKSPTLFGFDTTAFGVGTANSTVGATLTQAIIDAHLGTTSEFLLAAFDATAMGADAFGGILNMSGQVAEVYEMEATCWSGTAGATKVERFVEDVSPLTASSLTTQVAKGASGNIGFRVDFGNTPDFDGLTAAQIEIVIRYRSK